MMMQAKNELKKAASKKWIMKAASIVVSNDKQGDANACLLDGDPPYM